MERRPSNGSGATRSNAQTISATRKQNALDALYDLIRILFPPENITKYEIDKKNGTLDVMGSDLLQIRNKLLSLCKKNQAAKTVEAIQSAAEKGKEEKDDNDAKKLPGGIKFLNQTTYDPGCYIVTGEQRSGKTTLTNELAAAMKAKFGEDPLVFHISEPKSTTNSEERIKFATLGVANAIYDILTSPKFVHVIDSFRTLIDSLPGSFGARGISNSFKQVVTSCDVLFKETGRIGIHVYTTSEDVVSQIIASSRGLVFVAKDPKTSKRWYTYQYREAPVAGPWNDNRNKEIFPNGFPNELPSIPIHSDVIEQWQPKTNFEIRSLSYLKLAMYGYDSCFQLVIAGLTPQDVSVLPRTGGLKPVVVPEIDSRVNVGDINIEDPNTFKQEPSTDLETHIINYDNI